VGFDVCDLGVDVAPAEFVRCVRETGAAVMGISVLLTFSVLSVKKVVQLLEEEGLRDKVTVVLGGYPVDQRVKDFTGADYCEKDALKAVELIKRITL
jgi:methanogenic corrinoid protein MtbC1